MFTYALLAFLILFYHFNFFFDKVLYFRNKMLTNQKPELAIKKYHWSYTWYYIYKKIVLYLQKDSILLAKR